ncbi:MAG TPA: hypothetical protein PKD85_06935 [Saprospiraceae bacterium]|nr:hypothetical protein [Saprospiraceae bacterium]
MEQNTGFQYKNLAFDNDKETRILRLKGLPWKFINMLPYRIKVYMYRPAKTELIGVIEPHKTLVTSKTQSGLELEENDAIHVLRPVVIKGIVKDYEILRPVFLFTDSREVHLGTIMTEDQVNQTQMKDIWHDIIGIRIHNHITMPIDVYHKGNRIASISGDDGTGFMAGSPNSVYLNNAHYGFEIGDFLSFVFTHDQKPYATVKIIDNFTSDIILGVINQHFVPTMKDIFSYRVNEASITGQKYYDTVTAYSSIGNDQQKPVKPYLNVCAVTQGVKL